MVESVKAPSLPKRFWKNVKKRGAQDCWLWTKGREGGKGYGTICRNGSNVYVHRWMAEVTGRKIDGLVVRHSCDNKPCVNPRHLLVGTVKDNSKDFVERGHGSRGEANAMSLLTTSKVLKIRKMYAAAPLSKNSLRLKSGELRKIADQFGVSWQCVMHVVNRTRWKHVP